MYNVQDYNVLSNNAVRPGILIFDFVIVPTFLFFYFIIIKFVSSISAAHG